MSSLGYKDCNGTIMWYTGLPRGMKLDKYLQYPDEKVQVSHISAKEEHDVKDGLAPRRYIKCA